MGAGASNPSMEENYTHKHPPEPTNPQGAIVRNRPGSMRHKVPLTNTDLNRESLRSAALYPSKQRKKRATLLGRKTACTVNVNHSGFTPVVIRICEGQSIFFKWDGENNEAFSVTQIVHTGEKYEAVVGGYSSGPVSRRGYFMQQFNLRGEYHFVSAGIQSVPLTLEVYPREVIGAIVTDEGFDPPLIRIDQDNRVVWSWTKCEEVHSVTQVHYCQSTKTFVRTNNAQRSDAAKSGKFDSGDTLFQKVGLYYFQTESKISGKKHICIVHVRERQREYGVEIQDNAFSPACIEVEEGDRVWFHWHHTKCKRLHCPYEISAPSLYRRNDGGYQPKKNGFAWRQPTKTGLMSHEFFKAGVYYFVDHDFENTTEHIGTIVVKPKQKEHFIEVTQKGFSSDLVRMQTGDRVWFDWITEGDTGNMFSIDTIDKCVSFEAGNPALDADPEGRDCYNDYDADEMKYLTGLETTQLGSVGVYHYEMSRKGMTINTCSIISKGGHRDYMVEVSDSGFNPRVITAHVGDRIWWRWTGGSHKHNIIQVSHQGHKIPSGFCSGAPIQSPSAYMHEFRTPGVHYSKSEAMPKSFGAVIIKSKPTVHEIRVTAHDIVPDPVTVHINDVVAWLFHRLPRNELHQISRVEQLDEAHEHSAALLPQRRCISRLFTKKEVYHFTSQSFVELLLEQHVDHTLNDTVSSVLVDERDDSVVVRVDAQGFHPEEIHINTGMTVLWTWKGSGDEVHNIVNHAEESTSGDTFSFGQPVVRSSYLYTFNDVGTVKVASEGARGSKGIVHVHEREALAETPRIVSEMTGGVVPKSHNVTLACAMAGTKVYYTTDGTAPELHLLDGTMATDPNLRGINNIPELYNPALGVSFRELGWAFVRAVAVKDGLLTSDICTSGRYLVMDSGDEQSKNPPVPVVKAEKHGDNTTMVTWQYHRTDGRFKLINSMVDIHGVKFHKEVDSSMRFECMVEDDDGREASGLQHSWNAHTSTQCIVKGLIPGKTYLIYVVSNYEEQSGDHSELKSKSNVVRYTVPVALTSGTVLKVINVDINQVTLGWDICNLDKEVEITGFHLLIDGKTLGDDLKRNVRQTVIDNLHPGKTITVAVITLTKPETPTRDVSNEIKVTCPPRPAAPSVQQRPMHGTAVITWEKPPGTENLPYEEDIIYYKVFIENNPQGTVQAVKDAQNGNGYQFYMSDLKTGVSYPVVVRSYAGEPETKPAADHVYCLCESDPSNIVYPEPDPYPVSPILRLVGMDPLGIDVAWEMPTQFGDVTVTGFQMVRSGRYYGSIIPPDVHNLRIKDFILGERLDLQILALAHCPVKENTEEHDVDILAYEEVRKEVLLDGKYYACEPSPKLILVVQGMVEPPINVRCDHVTGHSATVVWSTVTNPRKHYVMPESYQVTWWPRDEPNTETHSEQTKEDHLLISALRINTAYNIVVEARKLQKYTDDNDSKTSTEAYQFTFIVTNKSEMICVRTDSPPLSPSNARLDTHADSITVNWDHPMDKGANIIGIRVDAMALNADTVRRHSCTDVIPDATSAVLYNLSEKSHYRVSVTAITEEYFDRLPEGNQIKDKKTLPKDRLPPEDMWLPSTSTTGMTAGTDAPSEVQVTKVTINSVSLTWKHAVVYGSNRIQGTVVRWVEGRFKSAKGGTKQNSVMADSNEITIQGLEPGVIYKFVVEVVVSVKNVHDGTSRIPEQEKQDRRTEYVLSRPVLVQMHAPCEPPVLLVTGYTTHSITLYWERPLLYSMLERDESGRPIYMKRSLEGYKLMVDGELHRQLSGTTQSFTVTGCHPGKTYNILLVAITCSQDIKKLRRKKMKGTMEDSFKSSGSLTTMGSSRDLTFAPNDFENDESPSNAVEVKLPSMNNGYVSEVKGSFSPPQKSQKTLPHQSEGTKMGDIQLDWALQGITENVRDFQISWKGQSCKTSEKNNFPSDARNAFLPVFYQRCVYDVFLKHNFTMDTPAPYVQKVQVMIPGPPDPPELWQRSVKDTEFVLEWGEPRCYGVRIRGYQIYRDGKKIEKELSSHDRRAVVPCKPNKQYFMNLVALSADDKYADSKMSNTVVIATGMMVTDDIMKVKIAKVTNTSINLDWWDYQEPRGLMYYKLVWYSEADSTENDMTVPKGQKACVIDDCQAGVTHFIRLFAMSGSDKVIEKSTLLAVKMAGPSGPPLLHLRSCSLAGITIDWDKSPNATNVTGYRVYVNGGVEAFLGPDQYNYTYTRGKWHTQYTFQIQALGTSDDTSSALSMPVTAIWPGIDPPVLKWTASPSPNVFKVTWEPPVMTDGIELKEYKLLVIDDVTGRAVQLLGPIHATTTEMEIQNLKKGVYLLYLEAYIKGSNDTVRSTPLTIKPFQTTNSPQVTVTAIGLEERRAIEKIACDLVNKRDRLLNVLHSKDESGFQVGDAMSISMTTNTLRQVEDMLDECLLLLEQYTGVVLANVSWTMDNTNTALQVSGYNVMVDGQLYGETLTPSFNTIKVKLGLDQLKHTISVIAICDYPVSSRVESNIVEILTEPFKPFSFYSFFLHVKTKKALSYKYALDIERKRLEFPINQGLLKSQLKTPTCNLLDIFDGTYKPLFPSSGPRLPLAILFWSKWCPYSVKTLSWFVRFATENRSRFQFMAVACEPREITANIRQDLLKAITDNGWREDNCIRHVVSQCISIKTAKSQEVEESKTHNCYWHHVDRPVNNIKEVIKENENRRKERRQKENEVKRSLYYCDSDDENKFEASLTVKSSDITELFGVMGVPTLAVVHPDDYIAWKGRYCAFDYSSFEHFAHYVFAQVADGILPTPDPWNPNVDYNILSAAKKGWISERQLLLYQQTNSTGTLSASFSGTVSNLDGGFVSLKRPVSAKTKLFHRTRKDEKLSVSIRPLSATVDSPYRQKLVRVGSAKRSKSAKRPHKHRHSTSSF